MNAALAWGVPWNCKGHRIGVYRLSNPDSRRRALSRRCAGPAGICLYNHGDYEPAAKAFQSALERFPDSDLTGQARYWLGMCQVRSMSGPGGPNVAVRARPPPPARTCSVDDFWLADTLRQNGDLKAAQEGYEKVVQNWPKSEWADEACKCRSIRLGRVSVRSRRFPR